MDKFIEKAKRKHGEKYDYSLVEYKNSQTQVRIICPIHGEFMQTPNNHLFSHGCAECALMIRAKSKTWTTEKFIARAREIHGNRYVYDKTVYIRNTKSVIITCRIHGDFEQTPADHINARANCPLCANVKRGKTTRMNLEKFEKAARKVHGDKYTYLKYRGSKAKAVIVCPKHGAFEQTAERHLRGGGCRICAADLMRKDLLKFITDAQSIHGNKYDYSNVEYVSSHTKVTIVCPKHGMFAMKPMNHLIGQGCPTCWRTKVSSVEEDKLAAAFPNFQRHNRKILRGMELDFYDPITRFAVEIDGVYWHSTKFKTKEYHRHKTKSALLSDVIVWHLLDKEVNTRFDTICSMLKRRLGANMNSVDASMCSVYLMPTSNGRVFVETHSLIVSNEDWLYHKIVFRGETVAVFATSENRLECFVCHSDWRVFNYGKMIMRLFGLQFAIVVNNRFYDVAEWVAVGYRVSHVEEVCPIFNIGEHSVYDCGKTILLPV